MIRRVLKPEHEVGDPFVHVRPDARFNLIDRAREPILGHNVGSSSVSPSMNERNSSLAARLVSKPAASSDFARSAIARS